VSDSKRVVFLLENEKSVRLTIKHIGLRWSSLARIVNRSAKLDVMFIRSLLSFSALQVRLNRFAMFKFYFFLYVVEDERDDFCFSEGCFQEGFFRST
jgi:hypothetical protein